MRRLGLVLALLGALLACPSAHAADPAAQFVAATTRFTDARVAADHAARVAAQRRRVATHKCASVWRGAPKARRGDLYTIWFLSIGGGFYTVDRPIFERWARDLSRIKGVAALSGAAKELKRQTGIARKLYATAADPCAVITKWRKGGWSAARPPAEYAEFVRLFGQVDSGDDGKQDNAARDYLEAHAGQAGTDAFDTYNDGVDEPDERIEARCDSIGHFLSPGSIDAC